MDIFHSHLTWSLSLICHSKLLYFLQNLLPFISWTQSPSHLPINPAAVSESLLQANILPLRQQMLEFLKVIMKILFDCHSFIPMALTALLIQFPNLYAQPRLLFIPLIFFFQLYWGVTDNIVRFFLRLQLDDLLYVYTVKGVPIELINTSITLYIFFSFWWNI